MLFVKMFFKDIWSFILSSGVRETEPGRFLPLISRSFWIYEEVKENLSFLYFEYSDKESFHPFASEVVL